MPFGVDPYPDPDPAIFVIDLQDANKKLICFFLSFCILFFEGTYGTFKSFSKIKSHKEVTKQKESNLSKRKIVNEA